MLYRIQIEQRFDKQKAVIEAVKELTNDFVILTGMAYFNGSHRPCQIIEINTDKIGLEIALVERCIEKLKKILNMPTILAIYSCTHRILY